MITGSMLRDAIISAANSIENKKHAVDELNIFPVPDGDTGTNMSMTMVAARSELLKLEENSVGKVAEKAASAMLRGARGNSGVILSLLFRGFSKGLKDLEEAGGPELANALTLGVEAAYKAVMKPTEGTILTVARVAGEKARAAASDDANALSVWNTICTSADEALATTPDLLPVLKRAGVVDAGGQGLCYIFKGMQSVFCGDGIVESATAQPEAANVDPNDFKSVVAQFDEVINFTYCTEFIVSRDNDLSPADLRVFLDGIGDSLVLVDDDEIIKVHVHTNNPGTVLEKALEYGALLTVKVENMRLQHTEKVLDEAELRSKEAAPEKKYGIVSVCAGEGIESVFRDLGVDGIVSGGQTMNPSTEDILEQIVRTPSEIVFVFPNNKNIIMAAEQTVPLTHKKVIVIPSKTIPQGITALLSFDPEVEEEELVCAMTEALANVDTMQITYAARDSDYDGYDIHAGDYLALAGKELFGTDQDLAKLLEGLAKKVNDSGREFITIYYGADTTDEQAQQAQAIFTELCPDADVNMIYGGQPVYYFLISAE